MDATTPPPPPPRYVPRSEHGPNTSTLGGPRRAATVGTDQTSEALLAKTEKRCVIAPYDIKVSLGPFVSTVGYDHNPVRDGFGDAVGGSGGLSVKRSIVRAQKAPSALHPETYSTRYCPRFSTHFYHPITTIPASERSEKTSRGCARGRQGSRVAYMRRQSRH